DGGGGHDVPGLVGVEAEHPAAAQLVRPVLDDADGEVAVLHGAGQVALLEGRAHEAADRLGHRVAVDEGLRAAADPRDESADLDLARAGRGRGPYYRQSGRAHV